MWNLEKCKVWRDLMVGRRVGESESMHVMCSRLPSIGSSSIMHTMGVGCFFCEKESCFNLFTF